MTEQPYVARFTPGPWFSNETEEFAGDASRFVLVVDGKEDAIARVMAYAHRIGARPAAEVAANAALTAAGPELYDALAQCETVLMIVRPRSHTKEYLACLDQVRSALAKAAPHTVDGDRPREKNTDEN